MEAKGIARLAERLAGGFEKGERLVRIDRHPAKAEPVVLLRRVCHRVVRQQVQPAFQGLEPALACERGRMFQTVCDELRPVSGCVPEMGGSFNIAAA